MSLARLSHVYQYSEDTGETLLSDAIHLYSVGNTREVKWQLNQGYSLSALDIDSKDTPRQVWLRLNKDGNIVEDKFLNSGDSITFYKNGMKILGLNVGTIFDGKKSDLIFISNVCQYSEINENDIIIQNETHLFIFGYATGKDWQLYENYTLAFMDIDDKTYPNQVWLRMKKNGLLVDDYVVNKNEDYQYYNNSMLLFEGYIESAFGGRYLDMLTLTHASQYSEVDSTPLIADVTHNFYPDNIELLMDLNEKVLLDENYEIVPVDVHSNSLWLRLYKDNAIVDETILVEEQYYSYYSAGREIISTKLAAIFMGYISDMINFEDLYQYSEVDGSLLNYNKLISLRLGRLTPPGPPVGLDLIQLHTGWNLISVSLNLTSWQLGNESEAGNPLNVTPANCLSSIYRYNTSSELFEKSDHIDDWGWYPATGSESFTALEPGRGYWVMAKGDCELTFTGTEPSGLNVNLSSGWNLIGRYSMEEAPLGEEAVVGNPLNVTPQNSLASIYQYNTTSGLFEKQDYLAGYGWWPATGSENFTALEPGRGYWVMASNDAIWHHRNS